MPGKADRAMRLANTIIVATVAALTAAGWMALNRPDAPTDWSGRVAGVSYSPFRPGQHPDKGPFPTPQQIDQDLALLAAKVDKVRVYTTGEGQEVVPTLALRHNLTVTLGAWIDTRLQRNEREVETVVRLARENSNVDRVIVGNEALLRGDVTIPELTAYIRRVKERVSVPVSTAETWDVWLANPELADAVDFIAVQILPYWDGTRIDEAVDSVISRYLQMRRTFPGKKIVLSEVGWPSEGRMRLEAKPGAVAQATFIRDFLARADAWRLDYYVIEAFDQPWKHSTEGGVGAYWGIWNADRTPKFAFAGPVQEIPHWPTLAALSVALGGIFMTVFLRRATNLRIPGRIVYAVLIQILAIAVVWVAHVTSTRYLTPPAMVVWGALTLAMGLLALLILAEGKEMVDALWTRRMRRAFQPLRPAEDRAHWPKVSLHLAICNEPPQMVMQTIDSLLRLDYPALEIIVVDNNTKDEDVWRPIEAFCADKRDRVTFLHLPECPGFKAQALNVALAHTAADAEIVGVVDSDYLVRADWLKSLVPYFDRGDIGFVQAPQDHRDGHAGPFKRMINWEYAGFFNIGMVQRNEDNAIIQHGTMTLIRRSALAGVGNWGEWCIVEDAELGLRLLEAGYESVYVNHSFGHGLSPDSFAGYKRQRFRWAYGAMQILKRHWRSLLLPWDKSTRLTPAQRYHFVMGWLPWFADALSVVLSVMGLVWTVGLLLFPKTFDFPLTVFLAPTIAVFAFKMVRFLLLYGRKVDCSFTDAMRANIAGLSLTFTIGQAILYGFATSTKPFLRTPKCENRPALIQALAMVRAEAVMLALLVAGALAIGLRFGPLDREAWVWSATLLVQALPYAAAVYTALRDAMPSLSLLGLRRPARAQPGGQSTGTADARS